MRLGCAQEDEGQTVGVLRGEGLHLHHDGISEADCGGVAGEDGRLLLGAELPMPPINIEILPDQVKLKLQKPTNKSDISLVSVHDVWPIQQGRLKIQNFVPMIYTRLRY